MLFKALHAFFQEHQYCGELDGGVEGDARLDDAARSIRDAWFAVMASEVGRGSREEGMTGDGALAHERDGHRVEAHAVARDAERGVGVIEEGVIVVVAPLILPLGLLGGYSMLVWCICRESGVRRLRAARHPTLCQRALAAYGLSLISTPAGVAVATGAEALAN